MKYRLAFILLLLCLALPAQDYIRKDYYAEGASREQALDALMAEIGKQVMLDPPALLGTWRKTIGRSAIVRENKGKTSMHLTGAALDGIFVARQKRASDILDEARAASGLPLKKTYYQWAWYYLASLPPAYYLSGKDEAFRWISGHPDVEEGLTPVPLTHILREVDGIKLIVGDILPATKPSVPESMPTTAALEPTDEIADTTYVVIPRDTLPVFPCASLADAIVAAPSLPQRLSPVQTLSPPADLPAGSSWKTGVFVSAGLCPEPVFGAAVSLRKKWGIILKAESDFGRSGHVCMAFSDGTMSGGGFIWPNGDTRTANLSLELGVSRELLPWLDAAVFAGYGYRCIFWKDGSDSWYLIDDISSQGASLGAGVIMTQGAFSALLSLSTVSFRTLGVSLGLGICF